MKITFQAFKWDCQSPTFRMQDFLRESSNRNGSLSRSRVSYFFEDGDYWVGLILTIKNMRKFVTLKQAQEAITLDVHVLDDNERIADFNFFVFNPTKGYGLYQHYYHSCSLNLFNYITKSNYSEYRQLFSQSQAEIYRKNGMNEKEVKKIMKNYRGTFKCLIVQRKGEFIEKIRALQDALAADIEFAEIDYTKSQFQPIQPFLKNLKFKMTFLKNTSKINKVASIVDMLVKNEPKKATIHGIDENGNDIVYRLFNDFDKFKEYDYEDFVPSLKLDQSKVADSIKENAIIAELKSVFASIAPSLP